MSLNADIIITDKKSHFKLKNCLPGHQNVPMGHQLITHKQRLHVQKHLSFTRINRARTKPFGHLPKHFHVHTKPFLAHTEPLHAYTEQFLTEK